MQSSEHQNRKHKEVGYNVGTTRLLGMASPTEGHVVDVLKTQERRY